VGGLVHFPRSGARRTDPEWHDPADNAVRSTRKTSEPSLITWLDANTSRDTDDDGDGSGGSAA
jgi:hypothetical protein